ncbi:hypothetical protein [Streptomyces xanthophaeus]|uniref:hypothetical protein n=1 Tax=Streptomyces xanthophaeus TaxID=67385 RepID=UPI003718014A
MVDKILGEVNVPPERSAGGSWREALEGNAEAEYGTLCGQLPQAAVVVAVPKGLQPHPAAVPFERRVFHVDPVPRAPYRS